MVDRPTPCAQCGISLEEASLLVTCGHHLCLLCAARALQRPSFSGGYIVRCHVCQAVTDVDEEAARYLNSLRPCNLAGSGVAGCSGGGGAMGSSPPPSSRVAASDTANTVRLGSPVGSTSRALWPAGWTHAISNVSSPGSGGSTPTLPNRVSWDLSPGMVLQPPRPVRLCGQCEERPAEMFCEQCVELFCRQCSAAVHRRGKMSQHLLRPDTGSTLIRGSDSGGGFILSKPFDTIPSSCGSGAGEKRCSLWPSTASEPAPLNRRFLRCPTHPNEPLQFFCLTCETECICAECALHGDHRSHEVLNLRDAVASLPERAHELLALTRVRAEELNASVEHVKKERRELANLVNQGKQELRRTVQLAQTALRDEERAMLMDVDQCTSEVSELLGLNEVSTGAQVPETYAELHKQHRLGDAIQALNGYVKLKVGLEGPPPFSDDSQTRIEELKIQLQQGFDIRIANIAGIAAHVADVRMASMQGADAAGSVAAAAVMAAGQAAAPPPLGWKQPPPPPPPQPPSPQQPSWVGSAHFAPEASNRPEQTPPRVRF